MKQSSVTALIAVVGMLAGFGFLAWYLTGGTFVPGQVAPGQQVVPSNGGTVPITTCESSTSTTVTVQFADSFTKAATGGKLEYRVKGTTPWTAIGDRQTISSSPGKVFEFRINSENITNTGFIAPDYTTPCKTTDSVQFEVSTLDTNTSVTTTVTNSDGVTKNAAASASRDSLVAGDRKSVKLSIWNEFHKVWGTSAAGAYSNVLVIEYNKTQYDNIYVKQLTPVAKDLTTTATPTVHATPGSAWTAKSFAFPVMSDNTEYTFLITPDVSNTYNPTEDSPGSCNITGYIYDSQLYLDATTTNNHFYGIEDELSNDVGSASEIVFWYYVK